MTNDYDGHSLLVAVVVEETCIYAGRGCEMTLLGTLPRLCKDPVVGPKQASLVLSLNVPSLNVLLKLA